MRFVILVPNSLDPVARGRKMPVPDARPSEKIAKLFPQIDPLKNQQKIRRTPAPAASPAAAVAQNPTTPTTAATGAAAGSRGPISSPPRPVSSPLPPSLSQPLSPRPMKRPPRTALPELPAPPRRKRSLSEEERALWESVAKQTKPLRKRPSRRKTAGFAGRRDAGRREARGHRRSRSPPAAKIPHVPKPSTGPAACAAGAPRTLATVARPQRNRRKARPARHDANPRPPCARRASCSVPIATA